MKIISNSEKTIHKLVKQAVEESVFCADKREDRWKYNSKFLPGSFIKRAMQDPKIAQDIIELTSDDIQNINPKLWYI